MCTSKTTVIAALRRLRASDPPFRLFSEALDFRRRYCATDEVRPGVPGVAVALELALFSYTPGEPTPATIPKERPPLGCTKKELIAAAETVHPSVYERFWSWIIRLEKDPRDRRVLNEAVAASLLAYARQKNLNIFPGP